MAIEIKPLRCEFCGGLIDRKTKKCKFCGTEYIIKDDQVVRIETFHNPIKDITARICIDDYEARMVSDKQDFMEHCVRALAHQMAEQLYDCMWITTDYDVNHLRYIVDSRIKAVVPERKSDEFRLW